MNPKEVIAEVLRDYEFNLQAGMSPQQSLEVLKAMLIDLIEYEKQLAYDLGLNAGQYSVLWDLDKFGVEYVRKHHSLPRGT